MRNQATSIVVLSCLFATCGLAQSTSAPRDENHRPLYEVTIVSRTTKAVNYGYLSTPTRIDFRGTPLLTDARGEAVVEPRKGATVLKLKFDHLAPPSRFGPQYQAYVVWAISPDGRAQNIGELTLEGAEKAKLHTSTPLQTFAMIVTAEPYYSVTQPSDVVVMENVVGPGTIGKVEEVNATYELLPRKPYTFDPAAQVKPGPAKMVNQDEYEATSALYQALNAIQIAQSQDADRYAPEQMARAREIYNKARTFPLNLSKEIVSMAKEATQIAEDSRAVALKRAEAERAAGERSRLRSSFAAPNEPTRDEPAPAPAPAPEPPPPAPVRPAPVAQASAEPRPPIQVDENQFQRNDPQAAENRRRLISTLSNRFDVMDSARGIVITLPEQAVGTANLTAYLAPVAAAMRPYRDLHVEVEGHSDAATMALTERNAEITKQALVNAGVPANIILARGFGNSRPRDSNATPAGRSRNRRVEVIISGDAIGQMPTWDHTYSLQPTR